MSKSVSPTSWNGAVLHVGVRSGLPRGARRIEVARICPDELEVEVDISIESQVILRPSALRVDTEHKAMTDIFGTLPAATARALRISLQSHSQLQSFVTFLFVVHTFGHVFCYVFARFSPF